MATLTTFLCSPAWLQPSNWGELPCSSSGWAGGPREEPSFRAAVPALSLAVVQRDSQERTRSGPGEVTIRPKTFRHSVPGCDRDLVLTSQCSPAALPLPFPRGLLAKVPTPKHLHQYARLPRSLSELCPHRCRRLDPMAPAVGAQPAFLHSGLAWAGMGWGTGTWDGSRARSSSCQAERTGEHTAGQATGEAVPSSQPWQLPG